MNLNKSILAAMIFPATLTLLAETGLQTQFIFPPQEKHVHSSSVVELPNGDLLACWYHGSGERSANDVLIQGARLKQGADKWSAVFLLADTPNLPDCNPVLFLDPQKRLWLFWVVVLANRWEQSLLKYRTAMDYSSDGAPKWEWQEEIFLDPGESFAKTISKAFAELRPEESLWAEYALPYSQMLAEAAGDLVKRSRGWMPRNHPITLPGGRILLPLYSDGFNLSLAAISDDQGKHWRASQPIVGLGPIQPTIVRRKDGTLVAYSRDNGGPPKRVLQSLSSDQGETWSPARDTEIPNPGSSLEVIALQDGNWAMIFNDTERRRDRLSLALSDDEGKSWKWKRPLEPIGTERGSYSYPSLIQSRDGRLHATYSYSGKGGETIKHAAFDAEWIKAGQ